MVLLKRLESLQHENPKIGVLDALRRLRMDFISELKPGSYSEHVVNFCEFILEAGIKDEGLGRITAEIKKNPKLAAEIGDSVAQNSYAPLHAAAEKFKIDEGLLLFVFETPLIPAFRELAIEMRKKNSLLKEGKCLVCGRPLSLGVYKNQRRYLLCKLCGAKYHVDLFWCPKCGNRDAGKLGFLRLEEEPELRIDYCFLCSTYIKAADEDRTGAIDDPLLFDIATLDLDAIAKERGLKSTEF